MTNWQKEDPKAKQEANKYPNPIPSREYILQVLTKNSLPLNFGQLAKFFNLKEDEQLKALKNRLKAMEKSGQLLRTRSKTYALSIN